MYVMEDYELVCVSVVYGVVYYESIKRELKTKPIYECRCDERPNLKAEESTRLACTGVHDKTN